ncbi:hypothetical protein M3Y98_01130700 [Aphelenchoides besseyi]|nr:hypothetical protein M3Y98_01130700 [Aphelenchoides besseyi]
MDLDPHILQLEPPVHYHNLFGCCCYWPIKSARLVAFFSLVSFFINLIFFITAGDYRALHLIIEIFVLFVEFVAVIFLFYGISHKKASYLKPYLLCGIIWNAFLFILWLLCLIQLFDKRGFHYEVLSNISVFVHIDADIQTIETSEYALYQQQFASCSWILALNFFAYRSRRYDRCQLLVPAHCSFDLLLFRLQTQRNLGSTGGT